jgi:uncharacterized protein
MDGSLTPMTTLDAPAVALLAAVGLAAGVINTLAGGGSLLTLPALVFLGLPAAVANGTNRVGVLVATLTGSASFYQKGVLDLKGGLKLLPASALGASLGAFLATTLDESGLRKAMAAVMVLVLILMWLRPERWVQAGGRRLPAWVVHPIFFAIGVYGGFIQAGVGVLLVLALLVARPVNLVGANAEKILLSLVFTVPALLIFALSDQVAWLPGLVLALSGAIGTELGARLAVKRGAPLIRVALTVTVLASALKLAFG